MRLLQAGADPQLEAANPKGLKPIRKFNNNVNVEYIFSLHTVPS